MRIFVQDPLRNNETRTRSSNETIFNSGETRIRPLYHLAVSRQQPDDLSGVESFTQRTPVASASPQRAALPLTTGSVALIDPRPDRILEHPLGPVPQGCIARHLDWRWPVHSML